MLRLFATRGRKFPMSTRVMLSCHLCLLSLLRATMPLRRLKGNRISPFLPGATWRVTGSRTCRTFFDHFFTFSQVSHSQYVFLMRLQRSIKALQQTLQQDLEDMGGLRKAPAQRPADQRPFTACLGLLLKSAEVALLLEPVAQTEGSGSPLGSELSPSESRGTLEPGGEGAGKGSSAVDQMLCGDVPDAKTPRGPDPLVPTAATASNHQSSHEEKNAERWNGGEGGEMVAEVFANEDETKFQAGEPLCEDKAAATKMPQSTSRYLFTNPFNYFACLA